MPYDFMYVERQKVQLTNAELKSIGKLYEQWAKDIEKEWGSKATKSQPAADKKLQMMKLRTALRREANYISDQVEKSIRTNIYTMSNHVVDAMYENLKNLGINSKALRASMASIPQNVVENIVSGAIYGGGAGNWRLSKAIWGDSSQTLSNLYKIVGGGIAQNKSIYEIANELSKYVNPRAAKQWNLKDAKGVSIYPKKVEYSAQRLARTLSQHAYQQSIVQTTLKNPMVLGIRWRANGPRVCDICKARDSQVYPKDELPLDHPNGMCVMEPIYLADSDDMIAKWVNSPAGTYPSMDEWAKELGYEFDGNNPSTPVSNIMRNEDNKKVAKQSYENDKPFDPQSWLNEYNSSEYGNYVMNEMLKEAEKYFEDESNVSIMRAFRRYTGNDYAEFNRQLREGGPGTLKGNFMKMHINMQDCYDSAAGKLKQDTYLLRELGKEEIDRLFGSVKDLTVDEMRTKLVGRTVKYDNYVSTAYRKGTYRGYNFEYYIKAEKGTRAMPVQSISYYSTENEVLLDMNTSFKIVGIEETETGLDKRIYGYTRKIRLYVEAIQ